MSDITHIAALGDVSIGSYVDRTTNIYEGPVILGEDLMTITIGDKVEVIPKD